VNDEEPQNRGSRQRSQNHTLHLLEEYVRHNEPPPTILEFIYIELDP